MKPTVHSRPAHKNNFRKGRVAKISQVTFHHIVGDAGGAIGRFQDGSQEVSATYVISSYGVIYQCVADGDTPYTDANTASNARSITIEHAGGHPQVPYTDAMYEASAQLVAWLIQTYGISSFKRHREVSDKPTACPGQLDVERIVSKAKALGGDMSRLELTDEEWDEQHFAWTGQRAPNPKQGNPHKNLSETINLLKNLPAAKEWRRRAQAYPFHEEEIAKRDKGIELLRKEVDKLKVDNKDNPIPLKPGVYKVEKE